MIRAVTSLAAALMLVACGETGSESRAQNIGGNSFDEVLEVAEEMPRDPDAAAAERSQNCLDIIWAARAGDPDFDEAERQFDRAHDATTGGSIACATASSASQFDRTLKALASAISNGDRAATIAEAGIPLLFIDEDGNRREISNPQRLEAAFDTIFTADTLERLQSLELEDMTVVPDKGGFFDLGSIWLVVPETGARPKLVTLNRQSAGELRAIKERAPGDSGPVTNSATP